MELTPKQKRLAISILGGLVATVLTILTWVVLYIVGAIVCPGSPVGFATMALFVLGAACLLGGVIVHENQ